MYFKVDFSIHNFENSPSIKEDFLFGEVVSVSGFLSSHTFGSHCYYQDMYTCPRNYYIILCLVSMSYA